MPSLLLQNIMISFFLVDNDCNDGLGGRSQIMLTRFFPLLTTYICDRIPLLLYFIIDYSLPLQMKSFGPKKFQISCMGKKVPFWQFFRKADMALFNLCMKIEKTLGQMISFEVVKNSQV